VGGDKELLAELAGMFPEESAKLLSEMRRALADGDIDKLAQAAHSLKGAVGNFASGGVSSMTVKLEKLARKADLKGAQEAMAMLGVQLARLTEALSAFAEGKTSCGS
ncbi:MAG: Hpt domain-containing protein, partial [Phycisphaerae bacterium]|nr:Hpt domain-containing protein [Phycisphaerae bacterium]